jgi:hypothetical protein
MKKGFIILVVSCLFYQCTKKVEIAEDPAPVVKTYSFYKTISVWDSVRLSSADVKNYKFMLTVFKDNLPFKTIISDGNRFYFENFTLGKYDILIQDPLNNFTSFRDSLNLDSLNGQLNYHFNVDVIKFPNFQFKRFAVFPESYSTYFWLYLNPVSRPQSFVVFYNRTKKFINSPYNRLNDVDSRERGAALSSDGNLDQTYRVQADVPKSLNSADTIQITSFSIDEALFKQKFNFQTGDSIYFFVLPAVCQYYYSSYIRNYFIPKNDQHYYGKNYNAINTTYLMTIPYRFN